MVCSRSSQSCRGGLPPQKLISSRSGTAGRRRGGDAGVLVGAVEGVGQGDFGNVLGVLILDEFGIDEEGHGHLHAGARLKRLLLEAEAFDLGEVTRGELGHHVEDGGAGDRGGRRVARLEEGQILEGIVKNITDYGAFIDLGGVDGLLHVTDIAWHRVNHPSEVLTVGQPIRVQIIRFNPENQRISLGMKQLESDPWTGADVKYPVGSKVLGRVTNITDYGAFIELEPGVEGLVHVTEMSWTKKNMPPGKIVSTSQEVEVLVLDVDGSKRRISLGMKQCIPNPWAALQEKYTVGSEIEGEVKNITEFGLFVGLTEDIDGMVHMSDISWDKSGEDAILVYKKGTNVRAKILDIDPEKERVSLGIKQLTGDPFEESISALKKSSVVTCEVTAILETGIEVSLAGGLSGFIRKNELSRDRAEQRSDRFAVGEKVDAKITQIDRANRKITLSIKARETEEERIAMVEYGSTDSGASLGDILGAALEQVKEKTKAAEESLEEPAPKKAKKKATEETPSAEEKPKKAKKPAAKKKDSEE